LTGKIGDKDIDLRAAMLKFIGEASAWQVAANRVTLEVARDLIKAVYPDDAPLVTDPFSGGGSIPLEALRLGCEVFASDLNPVALMILRVMLQHIPRHGKELSEKLRSKGEELLRETTKRFQHLYLCGASGQPPLAYLWARTIRCETSGCGAEIPIFRSPWLGKRSSTRAKYFKEAPEGDCTVILVDSAPKGGPITFRIAKGFGSQQPKDGYTAITGTKAAGRTASVNCPCCKKTVLGTSKQNRTAAQLSAQRGGADVIFDAKGKRTGGAYLLAVAEAGATSGKTYRLAEKTDYDAIYKAQQELNKLVAAGRPDGQTVIPEEPLPLMSGTFNVPIYGVNRWGDMFSARQKLAMLHLCNEVGKITDPSLKVVMAAVLGRCADYWSAGTRWVSAGEFIANTFGRQALGMVWDFAEACPWGDSGGNLDGAVDWVAQVIDAWPGGTAAAQVQQADSQESPLPDESVSVWFTDPPYYFAVPYADLSDYFFVWLKRAYTVEELVEAKFRNPEGLTPKDRELCEMAHWDKKRYSHKDQAYFESGMRTAFEEGRRVLQPDGIGCVVFAHKTTEGWEALLSGIIGGGWTITASWPIATERPTRLRAKESAALATSVHLVCRPRPEGAPVGDWGKVYGELPKRVADWMKRLQSEGVRGADLVFACIGPALEVYSRYSKVVDAEEREIPLGGNPEAKQPHERGFLAYVWEVVGRAALEEVLGTSGTQTAALEEDARMTALFLWTLQTTDTEEQDESDEDDEETEGEEADDEEEGTNGKKKKKGFSLPFDVVRRFAQPLGIHLDDWAGRCIETEKGIVRLIPVLDRAEQLFGEDGADAVAERLEKHKSGPVQGFLPGMEPDEEPETAVVRGRKRKASVNVSDESLQQHRGATTLDHVHAAMLLQSSGRANALRALLKAETERGPDFLRLANALSALYPSGCDEKRLLDAMLLAVPR
jgi:adenine-specific DNA methylase